MDSRLIFHEGKWVSVKLCDNAYFKGHGFGIGVSPQCLDGLAEVRVEIHYDELEKASCYLCRECFWNLKKSASLYGYRVIGDPVL